MFKERGKTVHTGAMLFYGGVDEKIFGDMLCDEHALTMSKCSMVGLTTILYDQFSAKEKKLHFNIPPCNVTLA